MSIDFDPGPELGPGIAHDLELQPNGLQLWSRGILNFYCEFFHVFLPLEVFLIHLKLLDRLTYPN